MHSVIGCSYSPERLILAKGLSASVGREIARIDLGHYLSRDRYKPGVPVLWRDSGALLQLEHVNTCHVATKQTWSRSTQRISHYAWQSNTVQPGASEIRAGHSQNSSLGGVQWITVCHLLGVCLLRHTNEYVLPHDNPPVEVLTTKRSLGSRCRSGRSFSARIPAALPHILRKQPGSDQELCLPRLHWLRHWLGAVVLHKRPRWPPLVLPRLHSPLDGRTDGRYILAQRVRAMGGSHHKRHGNRRPYCHRPNVSC